MTTKPLHVAVVGGGIGGAAAALAFHQRGIDVQLFEQATTLAEVGAGVALAPNGVRMLRRHGVGNAVDRWGSRWTDSAFCHADGTVVAPILPSTPDGQPIDYFGMHWADLLDLLVAGLPGDVVAVGYRCIGFEQDAERATVHFANGASCHADVVAADGIHSVLQAFVVPPAKPRHSGSSAYPRRHPVRAGILARRQGQVVDGGGQALPGLSAARQSPAQLRRVCPHQRGNAGVLVGTG